MIERPNPYQERSTGTIRTRAQLPKVRSPGVETAKLNAPNFVVLPSDVASAIFSKSLYGDTFSIWIPVTPPPRSTITTLNVINPQDESDPKLYIWEPTYRVAKEPLPQARPFMPQHEVFVKETYCISETAVGTLVSFPDGTFMEADKSLTPCAVRAPFGMPRMASRIDLRVLSTGGPVLLSMIKPEETCDFLIYEGIDLVDVHQETWKSLCDTKDIWMFRVVCEIPQFMLHLIGTSRLLSNASDPEPTPSAEGA